MMVQLSSKYKKIGTMQLHVKGHTPPLSPLATMCHHLFTCTIGWLLNEF